MKKKIIGESVLYSIAWSQIIRYDRHDAARRIPELPGVLFLYEERLKKIHPLLVYGCWRTGLRTGMRDLKDPMFTQNQPLYERLKESELYYKYCIVDSSSNDLQDIMYFLIAEYSPELNSLDQFSDSKRYKDISVKETTAKAGDLKLEASGIGFE